MFAKTLAILTIVLIGLSILGCRPDNPGSDNGDHHEHSITDIADANVKFIIADLLADAKLPTDVEAEKSKIQKKFQEELLDIDKLSDVAEQNRRYQILAEQSAYEFRFDEATEVAAKIQDKIIQDKLLEDIVRLQLKDCLQTYQKKLINITDTGIVTMTAEAGKLHSIQIQIDQIIKTAEQIDDPFCRARTFANIALFRTKMNDRNGAVEMMDSVAEFCRSLQDNSLSKAHGLYLFANWFLQDGDKRKATIFCQEAESILTGSEQSFESLRLYLDISSFYTLLGLDDSARQCCAHAEEIVSKISEPKERATALLKLAERLLVIWMKDETIPLAERLLNIKKLILEAAVIAVDIPDDSDVKLKDNITFLPLSKKELISNKNEILRKIASMQALGTTLEEAWETIEDIDSPSDRDDALVAAIEMMMIAHPNEDVNAWAEEITDPIKKKNILQKITP